ncbi:hypothetical protein [Pseudomonas sp. AL03]|uniref:hypothetical protein n=1 Tax=Pseudomonas sp. AL03 TaxID=3042230 RepID=UPI00249C8E14|nr:hypothetical protein [Pseudomonas sp. AL03]MDI3275529.1 hypothetical protein [Pseudomonas sp. AL03]
MNKVAIAAIDLGKHTFHLHAQDDRGHELYCKKVTRVTLTQHLANLEPCTVAALLEVGVSLTPGFKSINDLPALLETSAVPEPIKKILTTLHEHFNFLDGQVKKRDKDVEWQAAGDDLAARLMLHLLEAPNERAEP